MTDIVERLRADARLLRGDRVTPDCFPDLMDEAADLISELVGALEAFVSEYVELVESGDAGFWDAEKEPKVIAARKALTKARGGAA